MRWDVLDPGRYNHAFIGPMLLRNEGETSCRVRIAMEERHTNAGGVIHGGTILGFADVSIFAATYLLTGTDPIGSVTLDLSTQFIGAGSARKPLDSVVEVLRETKRLCFVRGLIVQGDRTVAAFSSTIRKPSPAA